MSFKVKKTRKHYYFIAFIFGMIYFLMHFVLRAVLSSSLIETVNMTFLVLDGLFIVVFYIKDILDEISMQRGNKPVGPSWFEHTSFIGMVSIHGIVIAFIDPPSIYITIQWIFAILLLIDFVWDLSQDIRAGPER